MSNSEDEPDPDSATAKPLRGEEASNAAREIVDRLEGPFRVLLAVAGITLLVAGVISAFVNSEGVATAAIVAAAVAVMFVAYLGPYITKLKFGEFEAQLNRAVNRVKELTEQASATVQKVKDEAVESVRALQDIAHSYETLRSTMPGGGRRDVESESQIREAEQQARKGKIDSKKVRELFSTGESGDRIVALGAMKAIPELRDFELVLDALRNPHGGFDQDRFLVLATEMLPELDGDQRQRLRQVVEEQRRTGPIRPATIRWLTSERLLRLLER